MVGMRRLRPAVAALVLIAVGLIGAGCSGHGQQPGPTPGRTATGPTSSSSSTRSATTQPKPLAYDPITGGRKVDQVVMAVKIDNVAAAHPQVGIDQADMIVVERVESDLTRLAAIFHTRFPTRVGPVRSARNTDVEFLPMFGRPALVFSGANAKVMRRVRAASLQPIERSDRDPSRPAPHNVIVDLSKLRNTPGIGKARPIGFTFGTGAAWNSAAADPRFKVRIGVDTFGFEYLHGHYRTSWNGQRYADGDSHDPVLADTVVRLAVKSHQDRHTTSHLSTVSDTVGSGRVTVYAHGKEVSGTWTRRRVSGPMQLRDAHGRNIPLAPGRTWILLDG